MIRLIKLMVLATVLCALPWTASFAAGSAPGHTADEVFVVPVKDHTWGGEIEPDKAITSQKPKTSFTDGIYAIQQDVLDILRGGHIYVHGVVDRTRLVLRR
jgi:hypothetical protein